MIRAEQLTNSKQKEEMLTRDINAILGAIDDAMIRANEDGTTYIIYPLPMQFAIPHTTNANAQTRIYYSVVKSLDKRGFHCKLRTNKEKKFFLVVRWISQEEVDELERQRKELGRITETIE